MARIAGVSRTAWTNYESGFRRIELDAAKKLRNQFGFTLDWIYEGDVRGMSIDLVERVRERDALTSSSRSGTKRQRG